MTAAVERAQLAVFKALAGRPNCIISADGAKEAARAVIEALRQADDDMLLSGAALGYSDKGKMRELLADCYTAMMDAALGKETQ